MTVDVKQSQRGGRPRLLRYRDDWQILDRFGILFSFLLLVIISSIASPRFLSPANIGNIILQISLVGIIAIGMTFVILTAGIDLSVGSTLALVGVLTAGIVTSHGMVAGIAAGLAAGAIVGVVNGLGVTLGRVQPFVMTLGMLGIARGLAFLYTGGEPIPVNDETFLNIGTGYLFGLPITSVIFLVLLVGAALVLRYTAFGRYVFAIGSNDEAARLSGVHVGMYKLAVYTVVGLLTGVAGVLYASQLAVGTPVAGDGYELDAIAAVVVGGTSLFGGEGGMVGTLLGAATIGVLANILNLTNVSPFVQQLAKGVLIILAVMIKARARRR